MIADGHEGPTPRRLVLVTSHGSVVYFDAAHGRLRHTAIGSCENNVRAVVLGSDVALTWRDGDIDRPIGLLAPDRCAVAADAGTARLTITRHGHDFVALGANGRFLCAEHEGRVHLSSPHAREWEFFLLLTEADFGRLAFILANRWLSRHGGEPTPPKIVWTPKITRIQMGRAEVSIADMNKAARAACAAGRFPYEIVLTYEGWKREFFILYRPLAYFVAFGKEEIFKCAEIAMLSLVRFGNFDGDMLLLTDATNLGFAERFPPDIRGRVIAASVQAYDVLDFSLARYKIADIPIAEAYQPVIYLDTDVICDSPMRHKLRQAALSRPMDLHICRDVFPLGNENDYFGKSLLQEDGIEFDPRQPGISSGIFAFRNVLEQKALFQTLVTTAYDYIVTSGRRDAFICYDQPFLNYLIFKNNLGDCEIFSDCVEIYHNFRPLIARAPRKGLVHFAGGVGNAMPKLVQMENYLNMLADEHAATLV